MTEDDLEIEKYEKESDLFITKHWLKPVVIDAPAIVRGVPDHVQPHDTFLAYLEFRINQKPTLLERVFGKRIL